MKQGVIDKARLAKRMFNLARTQIGSGGALDLSIGVGILQDAVEMFLLALLEHVDAPAKPNVSFEGYFGLINPKLPKELPFQARLLALNKLRVNAKHYGLRPDRYEVEKFVAIVTEFFRDVASTTLGREFTSISLVDLVANEDRRECLQRAQVAFDDGIFETCLIECRKAVYLVIEWCYDVAPFENPDELDFFQAACQAPSFATNPDYIRKHVGDATDYIVLDRERVELDLLKNGMESIAFWNVLRETPAVYHHRDSDEWFIKHDLNKLGGSGLSERAAYVLDAATNLVLSAERHQGLRRTANHDQHHIRLRKGPIKVFRKADFASDVTAIVPNEIRKLRVEFRIDGMHGGEFWKAYHFENGSQIDGYIDNADVKAPQPRRLGRKKGP